MFYVPKYTIIQLKTIKLFSFPTQSENKLFDFTHRLALTPSCIGYALVVVFIYLKIFPKNAKLQNNMLNFPPKFFIYNRDRIRSCVRFSSIN